MEDGWWVGGFSLVAFFYPDIGRHAGAYLVSPSSCLQVLQCTTGRKGKELVHVVQRRTVHIMNLLVSDKSPWRKAKSEWAREGQKGRELHAPSWWKYCL